jgi:hypothetical protein
LLRQVRARCSNVSLDAAACRFSKAEQPMDMDRPQFESLSASFNAIGGGSVPGVGTSDTTLAMLTPGEFVVPREAVSRIGADRLSAIVGSASRGGSFSSVSSLSSHSMPVEGLPHFASGGLVGDAADILTSRFVAMRAARFGVEQAEEEARRQEEERAAASTGDAEKYLKIKEDEYSGVLGGARYETQRVTHNVESFLGMKDAATDPDTEMGELAKQASDLRMGERQIKGQHVREREQLRGQDEQERAEEAGITGRDDREQHRGRYELQRTLAAIDKTAQSSNFTDQGFASEKDFQADLQRQREVAKQKFDAEQQRATEDQGSREDKLLGQERRAYKRMSGDTEGAESDAFDERIRDQSKAAHDRSKEEGEMFDKSVAPALRKEFDQDQQRKRTDDAQEAADRIKDVEARANEERLRAAGDTFAAEKEARFRSLDEQVQKLEEAVAREQDSRKKGLLQQELTATKAAVASEKESFQAGHEREDQEAAGRMRDTTTARTLDAAGRHEDAELARAAAKATEDVQRFTREGKPEEAKAAAEEFEQQKQDIAFKKDQREHARNVAAEQSHLRAQGKDAMANYEGFREREAEEMREAQASGDPKRIEQARQKTRDDLIAYRRDLSKPRELGDTEHAFDQMLLSDVHGGRGDVLRQIGQDLKDTGRAGGHLREHDDAGNRADASSNRIAQNVEQATAKLKELLDKAPKVMVAKDT